MLIQVEKDLPDMKHIKAVAGYILILSLCLVCAHPAHAETRRIALIHSFEPGYPPAAKALELLQKEFSLLGLDCDVREYYLDCDRYMEEAENLRMAGFVDDLSAWGAELIAVLDDQAAYALMACRHPLAHEIPVVFSGELSQHISAPAIPQHHGLCRHARLLAYHTHDREYHGKVAHLPDERTSVSGPQDMACVE